ncbi:AlpA family transcriptional regulator [Nocardia salmonicida]|uniref:helix-turn-helix transcriptional regulator n=1 Tax=Nocardia TaxID=1817 RepID=UPI0018900B04|nr:MULTISPECIES: helix-turn-helix domain-containing protein [Nocardia]
MSSRTVELPELLTCAQTAEYLGLTPGALAQDRARGTGPRYIKEGLRVRYRAQDIAEWLEARLVTPGRG